MKHNVSIETNGTMRGGGWNDSTTMRYWNDSVKYGTIP